jgi:hypothetical protein
VFAGGRGHGEGGTLTVGRAEARERGRQDDDIEWPAPAGVAAWGAAASAPDRLNDRMPVEIDQSSLGANFEGRAGRLDPSAGRDAGG